MIKGFSKNELVREKTPTITDVARAAGVSIATASVVVNNKCGNVRISESTKRRVQAAVRELGYYPNPGARGLRLKRTGLMGVIAGDVSVSMRPEILQGIEDVAKAADYSLILGTTNFKGADERYYLELLNEKKVDGIIVMPSGENNENRDMYLEIAQKGFPCVFVTRYLEGVDIPYVMVDGEALGYQATEHLIGLGHRRIAYVGITEGSNGVRFQGYCRALREHGIPLETDLVCGVRLYEWEAGLDAAEGLLRRGAEFSAVYGQDDTTALGVIACLKKRGLDVPKDVSVVGSDDIAMAYMISPALTTVSQPKNLQGEVAAQMLLDMINGKSVSSRVLQPRLIVRETTKEVQKDEHRQQNGS